MDHRGLGPIVRCLAIGLIWLAPRIASAQPQPLILFFGGAGTTAVDMRRWTTAARADPRYGPFFAFRAIAYPPTGTRDDRAASATADRVIRRLAGELNAVPERAVVLVGHSSGANVAASVLERLRDARNARLVILDGGLERGLAAPPGFSPAGQLACWSARSGTLGSVNQLTMRSLCANAFELEAPKCRTALCLHFWLVNKRAPLALDSAEAGRIETDGSTGGYRNLAINLDWLPVEPAPAPQGTTLSR